MTDLPLPVAARLRPPHWRDARLIVGIILVLSSVALGSMVVGRAHDRVPVFEARSALVPGHQLSEGDLATVEVQLGALTDRYLAAGGGLAPGRFVLSDVRAGELVPAAAVGRRDQVSVQAVTLTVDAGVVAALAVGTQVDVYVNTPTPGNDVAGGRASYAGPELLLHAASVAGLAQEGGALGGGSGDRAVQVMAPARSIKTLIAAVDSGARVTLVPVPGAALGGAP